MQSSKIRSRRSLGVNFLVWAAISVPAAGGCGSPAPPATQSSRPFDGTSLTVACSDVKFADELRQRSVGWAGRTGARIQFVPDAAAADIAVIAPVEIGGLAARGELAALPEQLVQPDNALHWNALLPVYSRNLCGWGGKLVALPLAGDGFVLAYRADRFADERHRSGFRAKTGRDLTPPATWDDAAEVAEYFHAAEGGKPSLPALPADPRELTALFYRIAASADRKAATLGNVNQAGETNLTFQFDLASGRPRLTGPAFAYAAEWLARTNRFRAPGEAGDPVAALDSGAVAAILSLADVARLPHDASGAVAKRFGVARLPASRVVFDKDGNRQDAAGAGNFIPYLGTGAKVGVVFARSQTQPAAWELLGELAGASAGLAAMGNPALGVGPFRADQMEEARAAQVWLRYGFDPAGTRALTDAIKNSLSLEVGNPTVVLRVPGEADLTAALAKHLRRAAAGEASPADALKSAAGEWEAIAAKAPDQFKAWLRAGAGLQ